MTDWVFRIIAAVLLFNAGVLVWAFWLDHKARAAARMGHALTLESNTETTGGFDFYIYPLSERDPEDLE